MPPAPAASVVDYFKKMALYYTTCMCCATPSTSASDDDPDCHVPVPTASANPINLLNNIEDQEVRSNFCVSAVIIIARILINYLLIEFVSLMVA